jgi:hypothetical protein
MRKAQGGRDKDPCGTVTLVWSHGPRPMETSFIHTLFSAIVTSVCGLVYRTASRTTVSMQFLKRAGST